MDVQKRYSEWESNCAKGYEKMEIGDVLEMITYETQKNTMRKQVILEGRAKNKIINEHNGRMYFILEDPKSHKGVMINTEMGPVTSFIDEGDDISMTGTYNPDQRYIELGYVFNWNLWKGLEGEQ